MTIDTTDLEAAGLEGLFDDVEAALGDHLEGEHSNVAVVSDPFAGRRALLNYAAEVLGPAAGRISLEAVVDGELPDLTSHEVILLDDCQYLYSRQVDGFETLDRFLRAVVDSDALVVTGWNRYAWEYLDAVRDVGRHFPVQIRIPRLEDYQVADLLESKYGPGLPAFVETGDAGRVKTLDFGRRPVDLWSGRTVGIPVPKLNLEYVTFRFLSDVEEGTRAVVFQKIATLSQGNPGVATALWERSVRDGEIAPAYVEEVDKTLELDDDAAFVLEIVVSKERVGRATLDAIVETEPIDTALQSLVEQGVVEVTDGTVSIVPERLHSSVRHLEGRQLIW